jgi:hypothetical protein
MKTVIIAMPLGPTMSAFSGSRRPRMTQLWSRPGADKRGTVGWFHVENEIRLHRGNRVKSRSGCDVCMSPMQESPAAEF